MAARKRPAARTSAKPAKPRTVAEKLPTVRTVGEVVPKGPRPPRGVSSPPAKPEVVASGVAGAQAAQQATQQGAVAGLRTPAAIRRAARERVFVDAWLSNGFKAKAAAIDAGCPPETARQQGYALLRRPSVQALLAERARDAAGKVGVTPERVLREYAVVGFSDVSHYQVDADGRLALASDAPATAMRAVSSVDYEASTSKEGDVHHKVKLRLHPKGPALDAISKTLGTFAPEEHKHTGTVQLSRDEAEQRLLDILARAAARKSGAKGGR